MTLLTTEKHDVEITLPNCITTVGIGLILKILGRICSFLWHVVVVLSRARVEERGLSGGVDGLRWRRHTRASPTHAAFPAQWHGAIKFATTPAHRATLASRGATAGGEHMTWAQRSRPPDSTAARAPQQIRDPHAKPPSRGSEKSRTFFATTFAISIFLSPCAF